MKIMKISYPKILAFIVAFVAFGCSTKKDGQVETNQEEPLSIILMIGDGMGVPQVSSAYYFGEEPPPIFLGLPISVYTRPRTKVPRLPILPQGQQLFQQDKKPTKGPLVFLWIVFRKKPFWSNFKKKAIKPV